MSGSKNDHGSTADTVRPNGRERQAVDPASGASIDKVRDILFGGQLREFERRFTRLEERPRAPQPGAPPPPEERPPTGELVADPVSA